MPQDDLIIGGYRRMNVMQTGQNSEVWQVAPADNARQIYAMKLLLPERELERAQRVALRREFSIGKKFDHPKIIRTVGFGREKQIVFILMEYFPSLNLKLRSMKKGHFEEFIKPRLRSILTQIAQGLDYLHSQKWVHRDIKPDNVLVDSMGNVKLIDFALAVKSASAFAKRWLRRRGTTAGTRSYMSPEQIRGYPVDIRSDVYSFGVLMYEMAAGRLPFVGASSSELLRKHLFDSPAPIDSSRKVTPEFEQILLRMLAKKEADRFQKMDEFVARLRQVKIFTDEAAEAEDPTIRSMR